MSQEPLLVRFLRRIDVVSFGGDVPAAIDRIPAALDVADGIGRSWGTELTEVKNETTDD
jgi:hypothetical protein